MYVHLMSIDKMLYLEIIGEPFIPKNKVDHFSKLPKECNMMKQKRCPMIRRQKIYLYSH